MPAMSRDPYFEITANANATAAPVSHRRSSERADRVEPFVDEWTGCGEPDDGDLDGEERGDHPRPPRKNEPRPLARGGTDQRVDRASILGRSDGSAMPRRALAPRSRLALQERVE